MAAIDYEAEYNNRARVPEHPAVMAGWASDAADYRAAAGAAGRAELGIGYGDGPRQVIDLFAPAQGVDAPLVAFLHGGYWQALDPSSFSHMARGLNAHGIAVAVVGYDLCPQVRVATIIDQARRACAFLWRRLGRRPVVSGHSAGGHLAACLVATDWTGIDADLPADLVPAGLSISGLFELVPLIGTSINDKLGLDPAEARAASPLFWPVASGRMLDAWVGGDESGEYLRQSRSVTEVWGGRGAATHYREVAGANHFTVIAPLADPQSDMVARLKELIEKAG